MKQPVIERLRSPLGPSSVLTLACGHLWSWDSVEPPPPEIDCIHCERTDPPLVFIDYPGAAEDLVRMDLAVRNLRRSRAGLPPIQPDVPGVQ